MPYTLRPANVSDIPRLAEVIFAAFESDPLHMAMFPREYTPQLMSWYYPRLQNTLLDPKVRTIVAVTTPDKPDDQNAETIVGYSRWLVPSGLTEGERQQPEEKDGPPENQFPQEANQSLVSFYLQRTGDIRKDYVDESRDIVLYMLATDPSYQGRGIGRMMLDWGINLATQLSDSDAHFEKDKKSKILLEATPLAYPMYKRFGWKDYNSITIDLGEYGVKNGIKHTTVCMVRE